MWNFCHFINWQKRLLLWQVWINGCIVACWGKLSSFSQLVCIIYIFIHSFCTSNSLPPLYLIEWLQIMQTHKHAIFSAISNPLCEVWMILVVVDDCRCTTRFVKCNAVGKPLTHTTIAIKKKWPFNATMLAVVEQSVLSFATNGAALPVGNEHTANLFYPRIYEVTADTLGLLWPKSCLPDETCFVLERPE